MSNPDNGFKEKEFKTALSQLPSHEKDKLILRLLKKDLDLANQLYFQLVSGQTKEDRRAIAQKKIENLLQQIKTYITHQTPGTLLMDMRSASGIINEHVHITKDKYGETYLHILIYKEFLQLYHTHFRNATPQKAATLNIYLISRIYKIMTMTRKLGDTFTNDFTTDLNTIGRLLADNPGSINRVINANQLDLRWLLDNNIPPHIEHIEKDLRSRGYLK